LALLLFALGLMSKPMVVTLPFVLLLLDYWPLQRFQLPVWWRLVWEKVPFFALAAGGSVVTFQVQKHTGAVITVETLQVGERAGNALISYCRYLDKLFWPTDLAVYYPHPRHWPVEKLLLAVGLLLAIWGAVYVLRRRWPFLLMGWVWFVGMLVPVLGLVQVGSQALADRYTYLPSLGILILVIWGGCGLIPESFRGWSGAPKAFGAAGSAAILLCAVLTRQQIGYWKDTEALFRHAIEVTKDNAFARNNLGYALINKGRYTEAINHYQEAIHLKPDDAEFHNNLGVALLGIGRASEAINELQEAIRLQPSYANAHNNLGSALAKKGRWDEAIVEHERALELQPDAMESQNNLAWLLATCPQANLRNGARAVELAEAASRSRNGTGWDYLDTLAATYAEAGQFPQAVEAGSRALALAVRRTNAPVAEIRARLKLYEAGLPYHETAP
jgi:Flp pilus assembly protein TadD